jgi:nitrate reductase gamma subunit
MERLLEFARGPLFAAAFLFMALGLLRQFFLALVQFRGAYLRGGSRGFNAGRNLKSIFEWLIPVGHIYRSKPLLSTASFVFHAGLLSVPLLLPHHIFLFKRGTGLSWPGMPLWLADAITVVTILAVLFLFVYRVADRGSRRMSGGMDFFLLLLLGACFVTGYMGVHPAWNPLSYTGVMLMHVLSGELILVLMPYSKLVHCVLFPFERISSDIFWNFPTGAAEKVAQSLHGKETRV